MNKTAPTKKTQYYKTSQTRIEERLINDRHHNEDGPACIYYNRDGTVAHEEYYINGIKLTKKWFLTHKRKKTIDNRQDTKDTQLL